MAGSITLKAYARMARTTDAESRAIDIRLRAEKGAGDWLAELPRAG